MKKKYEPRTEFEKQWGYENGGPVAKLVSVTVQHVKVQIKFDLEAVNAPWEAPDFKEIWASRTSSSICAAQTKTHDWRRQANFQLAKLKIEDALTYVFAKSTTATNKPKNVVEAEECKECAGPILSSPRVRVLSQ